jgi:hypothetical protein
MAISDLLCSYSHAAEHPGPRHSPQKMRIVLVFREEQLAIGVRPERIKFCDRLDMLPKLRRMTFSRVNWSRAMISFSSGQAGR